MKRLFDSLAVLCVGLLVVSIASAQIAGPNVNMVSGKTLPGGDPFLQRQNEPSIAASTRNPLHLLAGANDYRTVDIPFVPNTEGDDEQKGDAWLGIFKSFDGGLTWRSTLIPGYPQDLSPEGAASPLRAAKFQAAADSVVRAGTNGLFYYAGLALNRGSNAPSAIFVTRFIDNNNKESGDPIQNLGTVVVASSAGNAGTPFLDKPAVGIDIPRTGALNCNIGVQSFPGGNAYLAYSAFLNEGTPQESSQILFTRSRDCGATWSAPIGLTPGMSRDQGSAIAIDPNFGTVYVSWRRAPLGGGGSILVSKSTDGGQTFSAPATVATFSPFDQGSTVASFRTVAYPTIAVDGSGRVYLAWSERGLGPSGESRVVLSTSTDGVNWSPRSLVEPSQAPVLTGLALASGHQFMPSLVFSGGVLTVVYYDSREDETKGVLACPLGQVCSSAAQFVETRQPAGDLLPFPPSALQLSKIFNNFLADLPAPGLQRRHTLDLRVAQATPGPAPVFSSTQVSQYLFGSPSTGLNAKQINQLRFNPPNLPLFAGGMKAFIGDSIDVAANPVMVAQTAGTRTFWRFNLAPSNATVFHATWTDNRDVVPPPDGDWTKYTPPGSQAATQSIYLPSQTRPGCVVRREGMRDQNIYTSRITRGLFAGSPGNSKALGLIQRGFVIYVQNARPQAATYRLTIPATSQPAGGQASFEQFSPVSQIDVNIPARSSISRTVFVTSTNPHARIAVDVTEITAVSGSPVPNGLQTSVILNPDLTNPDLENPDLENPDLENPSVRNAEVLNPDLENPSIKNPNLTNPALTNPDLENPDLENPDLENPEITNPDLENPGIPNPDLTNPDLENPDLENKDLTNPDLENGALTDATWKVTNRGNTAAAYNAKLLLNGQVPAGFKTQLIIYRVYKTPGAKNCVLLDKTHNVLIANIPKPKFLDPTDPKAANPDLENPDLENGSFSLAPGEQARLTLRVAGPTKAAVVDFLSNKVTLVTVPQEVNTKDVQAGSTQPQAVASRVTIVTGALPDGVTGVPYTGIVKALSNTVGTPLTWTITAGALPLGLTLNPTTGQIGGTTQATGSFTFTVKAADTTNPSRFDSRSLTLRIAPPLVIATNTLPNGFAGTTYNQTLSATGGLGNLTFSLAPGSALLPTGLNSTSAGVITGVPSTAGSSTFTVQVVDSASPQQVKKKTLSLVISPATSVSLAFAVQPGNAFPGQPLFPTVQVRAQDSSGAALPGIPVTLTFVSNPGGATLSGNTAVTGTNGIASFPNLSVNNAGSYILQALGGAAGTAVSNSFTINPVTLYGTSGQTGNLLILNPATGASTTIGTLKALNTTPIGSAPALAVDPTSNIVFAGTGGGAPDIYRVNPTNATATIIGSFGSSGLGFSAISDLAFNSTGTLYASVNTVGDGGTGADHLAIMDKTNGLAATVIGAYGSCTPTTTPTTCTIQGVEGIAFDSSGKLWGSLSARGTGSPGLYTINTSTGAATFAAPILDSGGNPPSGGVVSLRFCNSMLYGGTAKGLASAADGGRLITINPLTGRFAYVGPLTAAPGQSLAALAFAGCNP